MTGEPGFAELYQTHYRRVRGLCRQLLGSADSADDAAQEVFVRAWRSWESYRRERSFTAWIMSIATNHCIDLLRRRGKEQRLFGTEVKERLEAEADDTNVLGELVDEEHALEVRAAVAALPPRYRVPLVLAYYNESSYEEIAAALGITRTHVGVLICRGKQALRRALEGHRS